MGRYKPSLRSRMNSPRSSTMLGTYADAPNAGSVHHLHLWRGFFDQFVNALFYHYKETESWGWRDLISGLS